MFVELDERPETLLPLYLSEGHIFPLILAVIQQQQRGWAFVNDRVRPEAALIVTKFGFMQYVGSEALADTLMGLLQIQGPPLPSYRLWYAPPRPAQIALDEFPEGMVRRRARLRFALNWQRFEPLRDPPPGFRVQSLDRELLEQTRHFKLDLGSRFWASFDDFLEHGVGVCVLKDSEVVSLCYAACVADHLAEIDVVTQAEYRGLGLAEAAVRSFISECQRRGLAPTWDCFEANTASVRLAQKLGFEKSLSYVLYSFNTPLVANSGDS